MSLSVPFVPTMTAYNEYLDGLFQMTNNLIRELSPAVSDQSRGPAIVVRQSDAGRLVTSAGTKMTRSCHPRHLSSKHQLSHLDCVDSKVKNGSTSEFLLV